jgi:hypothetical protein
MFKAIANFFFSFFCLMIAFGYFGTSLTLGVFSKPASSSGDGWFIAGYFCLCLMGAAIFQALGIREIFRSGLKMGTVINAGEHAKFETEKKTVE